ncbi:unnamed protein product, partial [Phaeothamnion confervicola]
MTGEEKAEFERERNRVHARNTRARKKQFVEELKAKIEELTNGKQATRDRAAVLARQTEWTATLDRAFKLRTDGVVDVEAWRSQLAQGFRLTLPLTPYRSYDSSEVTNDRRVIVGPEGMAADTKSLMTMCDTMARRLEAADGTRVALRYEVGPGALPLVGKAGLMGSFCMTTTNAVALGAASEVQKEGFLRVQFAADGRLAELDHM